MFQKMCNVFELNWEICKMDIQSICINYENTASVLHKFICQIEPRPTKYFEIVPVCFIY